MKIEVDSVVNWGTRYHPNVCFDFPYLYPADADTHYQPQPFDYTWWGPDAAAPGDPLMSVFPLVFGSTRGLTFVGLEGSYLYPST